MSGLILILYVSIYLAILYFTTKWVVSWFEDSRKRTIAGWITILILLAIPFGDHLVGRMYMYYLCKTDGGIKIYKQVEIDPGYFSPDADPNYFDSKSPNYFFKAGRSLREKFNIEDRYIEQRNNDRYFSRLFNIRKSEYLIIDEKLRQPLLTDIWYTHFSGWLFRGVPGFGKSCPELIPGQLGNARNEVFQPKK